MRASSVFLMFTAVLIVGCKYPQPRNQYMENAPTINCPDELAHKLRLSVEAIPIPVPPQFSNDETSVATRGMVARRIVISSTPDGLDRRYRVDQSRLSLRSLGGSVVATTRFITDHLSLDTTGATSAEIMKGSADRLEAATVKTSRGEIVISRDEITANDALGTVVIDVVLAPGDRAVDDSILRAGKLWDAPLHPLPPNELALELVSIHHFVGDQVEALIDLSYGLQQGRSHWTCNETIHTTLVGKEVSRQALWDIGVETSRGRTQRLVIYSPKLGVIRPLFDGSAEATSFASWVRATNATTAGAFALGLIDGASADGRQITNAEIASVYPLTPEAIGALSAGPMGEP